MAPPMPSITISYITLLKTICERLGLPEPIYNCADAANKTASVVVPRPNKTGAFYCDRDQSENIKDSCQSAAQKLVLFLVRKYKIVVHDINLGVRGNIERAIQLYKLRTTDLESLEKELPLPKDRECEPIEGLDYNDIIVAVDFVDILISVIERFQISVSPLETVTVGEGLFRSCFSIPRSGKTDDRISLVSMSFETIAAAKQDLARKAVTQFMHEYQFDVKDVNYYLLDGCKMDLKYEEKKYIATMERTYGFIENATPSPKLIEHDPLTPNKSTNEDAEHNPAIFISNKKRRVSEGASSVGFAANPTMPAYLALTLKHP